MRTLSLCFVCFLLCQFVHAGKNSEGEFSWGRIPLEEQYWENIDDDADWSFNNAFVLRENNEKLSEVLFRSQIPQYFEISYSLKPEGLGSTDGKGIYIEDKIGRRRSITLGDDFPIGIWDVQKSRYDVYLTGLDIGTSKYYDVSVMVERRRLQVTVNGNYILATSWDGEPPFNLGMFAQRTGFRLKDLQIRKSDFEATYPDYLLEMEERALPQETRDQVDLSSVRKEVVVPARKGDEFYLEVKSFDDLLKDQISYHVKNTTLTEEEVRAHFESQERGVQENYSGTVFAYGYILDHKPLHVVFAPVNGGRMEPSVSGMTDKITFFDSSGDKLAHTISSGGWGYQTTRGGGSGSNVPRLEKGMRGFHYVFSVSAN